MITAEQELELRASTDERIQTLLNDLDKNRAALDWVNMSMKNALDRVGATVGPELKILFVLALMQDRENPELRPYLDQSIDRLQEKYARVTPEDEDDLNKQLMAAAGRV